MALEILTSSNSRFYHLSYTPCHYVYEAYQTHPLPPILSTLTYEETISLPNLIPYRHIESELYLSLNTVDVTNVSNSKLYHHDIPRLSTAPTQILGNASLGTREGFSREWQRWRMEKWKQENIKSVSSLRLELYIMGSNLGLDMLQVREWEFPEIGFE